MSLSAVLAEKIEGLKAIGVIREFFITKSKGDILDGDMRSSNRVASFIVEAANFEELKKNLSLCLDSVKVIDSEGNNVAIMPN